MSPRANGTITTPGRHGAARVVVGAALVLTAIGVAWASYLSPGDAPSAWVAQRGLPRHAEADPTAFVLAPVSVPQPQVLWPAGSAPTGQAVRTIAAGEPLLAADLVDPAVHHRVTLPVDPQNMPADLMPGDAVDVWSGGDAAPLVAAAVVQSVSPPDIGAGRVEIAVSPSQVAAAVRAAATDRLILVRLP